MDITEYYAKILLYLFKLEFGIFNDYKFLLN